MPLFRDITGLLAQGGDPRAALNLSNRQSQQVSQNIPEVSPIQKFNEAVLAMLLQSQKLGTKQFEEQNILAQEEQIRRGLQKTPQELIGASPDIQAAVRSASIQALQPTISIAEKSKQTFKEQISAFENVLKAAKEYGTEIAKINPSQEVTAGYIEMIRAGGSPATIPDEVRGKILSEAAKDPNIWREWQEANNKGIQDQLSLYQQQQVEQRKDSNFLTLQNRYQSSPLITAANRAKATMNLIPVLERNPGARENQLIALYQFIQVLDSYQSSVREGEIGLATGASSLRERIETGIKKLESGQVNNPAVTLDIVKGMKTLINAINTAAKDADREYAAAANTAGIGDRWENYRGQLQPQISSTPDEWEYIPPTAMESETPTKRFDLFSGMSSIFGKSSTPRF